MLLFAMAEYLKEILLMKKLLQLLGWVWKTAASFPRNSSVQIWLERKEKSSKKLTLIWLAKY